MSAASVPRCRSQNPAASSRCCPAQVPLIGFIGRLDFQKGADLVLAASHWLLAQDVQLVCLGTGDQSLEVRRIGVWGITPIVTKGQGCWNV